MNGQRLAYLRLRLIELGLQASLLSIGGHRSLPEALCRLALALFHLSSQPPKLRIKRMSEEGKGEGERTKICAQTSAGVERNAVI